MILKNTFKFNNPNAVSIIKNVPSFIHKKNGRTNKNNDLILITLLLLLLINNETS